MITRDQLITDNIPLVKYVVNQFYVENEEIREELYQEGIFGLINAADKFDENKDYKFSTFAIKSIKGEMLKYIRYLNRKKRKSNINTISLDKSIYYKDEDITLLDAIIDDKDDYSSINCESILQLVEETKIKDAKYIILKRLEGYKFQEIADDLGIGLSTVEKRVKDIRIKIKNKMKYMYVS